MIVTDIELKDTLYSYVKNSKIIQEIDGSLYKDLRPLNSTKEDIIISVIARDARQLQNFIVNINLYVPDVKRGQEYIEDTQRLRYLSKICAEVFDETVIDKFIFSFEYQDTMPANGIGFHVINNRLRVTAYTGS